MLGSSPRRCRSKGFLDTEKVKEELDFTEQSPSCGHVSVHCHTWSLPVSLLAPRVTAIARAEIIA